MDGKTISFKSNSHYVKILNVPNSIISIKIMQLLKHNNVEFIFNENGINEWFIVDYNEEGKF